MLGKLYNTYKNSKNKTAIVTQILNPLTSSNFQIVPDQLLRASERILIVSHLAIGDFCFMHNHFVEFKKKYPNLTIDMFVDDRRRTLRFWRWKNIKNYILYDWFKETGLFNKIHHGTYSWLSTRQTLQEAKKEKYDLVVILSHFDLNRYAKYARTIAPNAFIAGNYDLPFVPFYRRNYLDKALYVEPYANKHVSYVYSAFFEKYFGIELPKEKRFVKLSIPKEWKIKTEKQLHVWGATNNNFIVFINPFAKPRNRSWPIGNVFKLISCIEKKYSHKNLFFIINSMPNKVEKLNAMAESISEKIKIFSAVNGKFFSLPAMIKSSDVVISVDTAIIHLANAQDKKVIMLMRKSDSGFIPLEPNQTRIVFSPGLKGKMKEICVEAVTKEIDNSGFLD